VNSAARPNLNRCRRGSPESFHRSTDDAIRGFTMSMQDDKHNDSVEAWIGLAHVKPRRGNEILGTSSGAVVPVLALARDQADFVSKVIEKLESYDFDVVEIDDMESCSSRFEKCEISSEVKARAESLSKDNPVALHTFHTYVDDPGV
jgi:hypothetical protein